MSAKNFKDQDLTGQNFDNQDLSWSLFRGANMTNCSFVGAKLNGINLRETTIEGCDFTDAEMFYCNQKDAQGTATWTNAKVFGTPKWIPMPGSDNTTTPPLDEDNLDPLFPAVFEQTPGFVIEDLIEEDKLIIRNWKVGFSYIGDLTGSYPITDHGRDLYDTLGWGPAGVNMGFLLNEAMLQKVTFNTTTQLFYKPNP